MKTELKLVVIHMAGESHQGLHTVNILSSISVRVQGCLKMNGLMVVSDSTNVMYWGGALGRTIYVQTPH